TLQKETQGFAQPWCSRRRTRVFPSWDGKVVRRIAFASSDYEPSPAAKTYAGGNDESSPREPTVCPTQHSTPQFLAAAHRRPDRRIRSGRRGNTDGNRANGGDRLQHVPRSEERRVGKECRAAWSACE